MIALLIGFGTVFKVRLTGFGSCSILVPIIYWGPIRSEAVRSDVRIYCVTLNKPGIHNSAQTRVRIMFHGVRSGTISLPYVFFVLQVDKAGDAEAISSDNDVIDTNKYQVTEKYRLRINDIVWDDEGEYRCTLGVKPTQIGYVVVSGERMGAMVRKGEGEGEGEGEGGRQI